MIVRGFWASVGLVLFACGSSSTNDTDAGAGGAAGGTSGTGGAGGASGASNRVVQCEVPAGECKGGTGCCFVSGGNPDSCIAEDAECESDLSDAVLFDCDDSADCADGLGSICCFDSPLATCRLPQQCEALQGLRLCDPGASDCPGGTCTVAVIAGGPYLGCIP